MLPMSLCLVQDLTFETDDLDQLAHMLHASIELLGSTRLVHIPRAAGRDPLEDEYPSAEAAYMTSFLGNPPHTFRWQAPSARRPMHYWRVCRLLSKTWETLLPFEQEVAITSDNGVDRVLELIRAIDPRDFGERTGAGPFKGSDGSVALGYRLWHTSRMQGLVVALCHIYYSK
jgi:hypothetical protein